MSAIPTRLPDNNTGIFLYIHRHEWREVGTHTWPSGKADPTFRCRVCGDVICTPASRTVPITR
ncbi:MAG: hypothetical protein JJE50_15855 [Actinomycetales bacterium]|nr:hypothetical protein [Actinomycetales bacterium]